MIIMVHGDGMIYRIYPEVEKTRFFIDVHTGHRIPYYTAREMEKRYPDGSFVIIGEIGGHKDAPAGGDQIAFGEEKAIPIHPRGSVKPPFEWVIGYAPVQEKSYVAVIGGIFQFFRAIVGQLKKLI